jgi:D-alanyl-D-alanine carboxypeptidase
MKVSPEGKDRENRAVEVNRKILNNQFSFTGENFPGNLSDLPEKAMKHPGRFLDLAAGMLEMPGEYLVLVDKNHPLPPDFKPGDIVDLKNYPVKRNRDNLYLDRKAAEALSTLSEAAGAEGLVLRVSSAYRSYEYQRALFNRYAEKDGEEAASRYSARAGTSQHQLGSTVDFGSISDAFAESPEGLWMTVNAGNFGWSLSYPRGKEAETGYVWESWHWRWIGNCAVKMQNEFFAGSQQQMLMFWDENAPVLRKAWTGENTDAGD